MGVEGFVNVIHASVNVICFESCVLYSSGVILCCVRGSFPLTFYGGTVSEVDCKFSYWVTCISRRRETTAAFAAY